MSGNLPPGCTQDMIDRAFGADDDRYDFEPCACEEFDTDHDGRRECCQCGRRWWPTAEEIAREVELQREYDRWQRQEARKLTLPIRWPIYRLLDRIWPRKSLSVLLDDEIPF